MAMFSGLSPEEQQYMETQRLEIITLKQTIARLEAAGAAGFEAGRQRVTADTGTQTDTFGAMVYDCLGTMTYDCLGPFLLQLSVKQSRI